MTLVRDDPEDSIRQVLEVADEKLSKSREGVQSSERQVEIQQAALAKKREELETAELGLAKLQDILLGWLEALDRLRESEPGSKDRSIAESDLELCEKAVRKFEKGWKKFW